MKKLHYLFVLPLLCSVSKAGLITHTDYNSGAVITSAGQNTNENTIYNEFNGSIDNTNIKTGGVTGTNIANATIAFGNMNTIFTSSFTAVQNVLSYRRPNLKWVSSTQVLIETGTLGDTNAWVLFPDGNLRGDATTARIQLTVSQTASLSGSWQSGMRSGSNPSNSWVAVYAVKTTDNSSHFVAVGDSVMPIVGNYATLNSNFGTNGWVYLGMARAGNNSNQTTAILQFVQDGHMTMINTGTSETVGVMGVWLSSAASNSSSWNYATGSTGITVPENLGFAYFQAGCNTGTAVSTLTMSDGGGSRVYSILSRATAGAAVGIALMPISQGIQTGCTSSGTYSINSLLGWVDNALGVGSNPLF